MLEITWLFILLISIALYKCTCSNYGTPKLNQKYHLTINAELLKRSQANKKNQLTTYENLQPDTDVRTYSPTHPITGYTKIACKGSLSPLIHFLLSQYWTSGFCASQAPYIFMYNFIPLSTKTTPRGRI